MTAHSPSSWTKTVPLAQREIEQWYAKVGINDESGDGWILIGSGESGSSEYTSDPAPITTANMARDLAHELNQLADRLEGNG